MQEVQRELEDPQIWNNPEKAQNLGRERAHLDSIVHSSQTLETSLKDTAELFDLAVQENDSDSVDYITQELEKIILRIYVY